MSAVVSAHYCSCDSSAYNFYKLPLDIVKLLCFIKAFEQRLFVFVSKIKIHSFVTSVEDAIML